MIGGLRYIESNELTSGNDGGGSFNQNLHLLPEVKKNSKYLITFQKNLEEFQKETLEIIGDIIGEIEEVYDDSVSVLYTDRFIAGWNSKLELKKILLKKSESNKLDNGLNSMFLINMKNIKELINGNSSNNIRKNCNV